MSEWISVETKTPLHGDRVRTKDSIGREYECQFFHWTPKSKPYFKLVGSVFDHEPVTHWKPSDEVKQ